MSVDFRILYFIQDNLKTDFADGFFSVITHFADSGVIWMLAALALVAVPKTRRAGIVTVAALLIGVLVGNVVLKPGVARIRPYDVDPSVPILVAKPNDFSMPSGHTLSSFAGAVAILCFDRKSGIAAILLAALIGFSRLYLFIHYPTDVLAGVFFGAASAILAYNGYRIIELRFSGFRIGGPNVSLWNAEGYFRI